MIMSPPANMDNGTFTPNTKIRYALTQSETQALTTVLAYSNRSLGLDFVYSTQATNPVNISPELESGNFTDNEKIVYLIRNEVVDNPFVLYQYLYKLSYDPRVNLNEQLFSRVYDCGSVNAYIYSGNNETTK